MSNCNSPDMSVSTRARVGSPSMGEVAKVPTMRDMMAVGPSVMSFDVPMNM